MLGILFCDSDVISTVHGIVVGSICPVCGRTLKTVAVLKDHISYLHEGEVKFLWNHHLRFAKSRVIQCYVEENKK